MNKHQENIIEGRENPKINALIYSMRYQDNSGFSVTDIRTWDTSTEKIIDDDEMERIRLDLELRRLRRIERTRSLDELESIKSEENPYSSLGSLSPMELVEIGAGTFLDEEILQKKLG